MPDVKYSNDGWHEDFEDEVFPPELFVDDEEVEEVNEED